MSLGLDSERRYRFFFWGGGSVRIVAKIVSLSFMSVRLSACISAATFGQISMKFDIGDCYDNLSRKFQI
jgi:hypothetical protein